VLTRRRVLFSSVVNSLACEGFRAKVVCSSLYACGVRGVEKIREAHFTLVDKRFLRRREELQLLGAAS
jgi:hypothetical protein